ncbi:MAG: UTP--glucose-1-phosphate uridylyltransferase [Myxococcales bacterium]|nr:UTP--glucose-1-phosphate uridylyltransferase [Myxococcales bacterium]
MSEQAFVSKMRDAGQPEPAIASFVHYYRQLSGGATGLVMESDITPVHKLPDAANLTGTLEAGRAALDRAVVIKLNGGLGTSMGMARAKSLLEVKKGASFLDIIAKQVLHQRDKYGAPLPLVLMNSFRTQHDSLAALEQYPDLALDGLPLDFVQHRVPKVLESDLSPATSTDEGHCWCPPGHGDLYTALLTSGMLEKLRARGMRWAFVSNADNLGATLDPEILGYMVQNQLPFLMEVADRTEADRKGGHLAKSGVTGRLLLRESAQCPTADIATFQDWTRHRYFNTNNLWVDLDALAELLAQRDGVLGLPMIRNRKRLVPTDPESPRVLQLETAMGAALEVFKGAGAIRVPRTRFAPVKTTNDLLRLRSDVYTLSDTGEVLPHPSRANNPPIIDLDRTWFAHIDQLETRFPAGAPSLLNCRRLRVVGDVHFGANIVLHGIISIRNDGPDSQMIRDHTRLGSI